VYKGKNILARTTEWAEEYSSQARYIS
jgi:hypothetical protein